jgi:hypothetical protein
LYSKYVLVCKELEELGNIILTYQIKDDTFKELNPKNFV